MYSPFGPVVVCAVVYQPLPLSSWSSTVVPAAGGFTAPDTIDVASARAVTTGATGTFSTAPASLPAEMRKLAGASSFTLAASTAPGPATCVQTPSIRWDSTAPFTPAAFPVTVSCLP